VPLPVQALDHATGYLMAAAALRGLSLRRREQAALTARLSLARTAMLLAPDPRQDEMRAFVGATAADYAEGIEPTPWGAARRLRSPVTVGKIGLRWDRSACELGSARPEWV
jgi:hypothetical protein